MLSSTTKEIKQAELSTMAYTKPTANKSLYIGADDFRDIRQRGKDIAYVDKTLFIKDFLDDSDASRIGHTGKNISKVDLILRPRRFGKTMNMTMLHEFLSNRRGIAIDEPNLFEGLAVSYDVIFCQRYQNQYPVIFLSLKDIKTTDFSIFLNKLLSLLSSELSYYSEAITKELRVPGKILEGMTLSHSELRKLLSISEESIREEKNDNIKAEQLEESLFLFSKFLYFHYERKAIILIDEYDSPVNNAYQGYIKNQRMLKEAKTESDKPSEIIHKDFPIKVNDFIRHWLGKALKGNPFLAKGLMTGIYPMTKRDSASDLNNVSTFTLLDSKYAEYFGFTEKEIAKVLSETGSQLSDKEISRWYNGYQVFTTAGEKLRLYNPWSVVSNIDKKLFKAYWENTGSHEFIENFILHNKGFRNSIQQLTSENKIRVRISEVMSYDSLFAYDGRDVNIKHDIWSTLFYLGYITLDEEHLGASVIPALEEYAVRCPNLEIYRLYYELLERHVFREAIRSREADLFNVFLAGKPEEFFKLLKMMLMQYTALLDMNSEKSFQLFMDFLMVFLGEKYEIDGNDKETGLGRSDHLLIPKDKYNDLAWIIEYKYVGKEENEKALQEREVLKGLDQIARQRYIEAVKSTTHVKEIIRLSIAFWKKVPLFGVQRFGITQIENSKTSTIRFYEASEDTGEVITRTLETNPLTEQRRKRERSESDTLITAFFEEDSTSSEAKRTKKADEGDSSIKMRLRPRY